MINLIPKEEKKKLVKNLYYRLVILFLFVISMSSLVIAVSMLPAYFLASTRNSIVNKKLELQKNEPVPLPDQETLKVIKDVNSKINLVNSAETNKFSVSERVINSIILKKLPGIQITDISYLNSTPDGMGADVLQARKISIQGNAPSRELLLMFRQALEDTSNFKQVDLPISNFVKGSNIQFYLSLIPA